MRVKAPYQLSKNYLWSKNVSKKIAIGFTVLAAAVFAAGVSGKANAQSGVKAGALTCDVDSGWGVIFGSSRDLKCSYQPTKGKVERYVGHISKYGVDIGYTKGGVVVWAVLAPTTDVSSGALAGDYAGATAGATFGIGAGAHVLVGGLKKSIALQPVSIEGNAGLNVAAGIANIHLTHVERE
jgi:hypothetical protein